jgi:hypothetical protein
MMRDASCDLQQELTDEFRAAKSRHLDLVNRDTKQGGIEGKNLSSNSHAKIHQLQIKCRASRARTPLNLEGKSNVLLSAFPLINPFLWSHLSCPCLADLASPHTDAGSGTGWLRAVCCCCGSQVITGT